MKNILYLFGVLVLAAVLLTGCGRADGNDTGTEYMPDMAHSLAYEANTYSYYHYNQWSTPEEKRAMSTPRKPVQGTIPRGYAGGDTMSKFANERVAIKPNGSVPYYYEDTDAERLRAEEELSNPFPITEGGLAKGKELYEINCAICHGKKGEANGTIVESGVYPAVPSSYLNDEFIAAGDGRYYHAIMHGKNMMGHYKDKLSYEERWQVIHYIRSLQAKSQGREYLVVAPPPPRSLADVITSGSGSITLDNVQFNSGSAKLKSSSYEELNDLALLLVEQESVRLSINGHTDNVGKEENNRRLSQKRAEAVLRYLAENGVDDDRLIAQGYGADQPIDSNDTDEGRAKNRRTEVSIVDSGVGNSSEQSGNSDIKTDTDVDIKTNEDSDNKGSNDSDNKDSDKDSDSKDKSSK